MKVFAIISEYNPFHLGHKYQIDKIKQEQNPDAIIAVMSGNFTQRATPAIADKWTRANCALLNGVDLVIELPIPFSISTAQNFAFGGVSILNNLGCVTNLSFGSECGDIKMLQTISNTLNSNCFKEIINQNLNSNQTFAKNREQAIKSILGNDYSLILQNPNNNLAIEYINALNLLNSNILPHTIKRFGANHDTNEVTNNIASASFIREKIISTNTDFLNLVPQNTKELLLEQKQKGRFPVTFENHDDIILSLLRMRDINTFKNLPDISEGIENRIISAISKATSTNELYELIKTKRYTLARIRRLILYALLNINSEIYNQSPSYARVLGFNNTGSLLLKKIKQNGKIPIVSSKNDYLKLDQSSQNLFNLTVKSTDLYNCLMPKIHPCSEEFTKKIITIK